LIDRSGTVTHRTAALIGAALLTAMLTGCSSTDMLNVPQDDHAELQVWVRQPPGSGPAKTADRLVKAFTQKTGYKARAVALYEDFETKLQQQAAYRQLPDIVINDTAQLGTMQTQGWLQQVDRVTFPGGDQISDRAWKAAQAGDGNYYAVPMTAHTFALFVRADWRARLKLPVPTSWDDVKNMAIAFTTKDPDGNGKNDTYGLVVPGTTKRGYMAWYFSNFLLDSGGDFLAEVQPGRWVPAINDAKGVAATTWLKSMFCQYKVVNPDAVQIDTPRAHDTFEKGIGGVYLTGPYMLPRFVKSMSSQKLEVFPLPVAPGAAGPSALAEGENVYLTMGSRNRAGQKAFAQFATSVEGQTIAMDAKSGGPIVRLPVNTRVDLGKVRSDPRWTTFQQVYASAKYTPPVPNWAPFRQMAADGLNSVMADCGSDVKGSLDKLAAQFSDELRRQNVYGG
jgi:multiple sugar transport system substrate-binding protein